MPGTEGGKYENQTKNLNLLVGIVTEDICSSPLALYKEFLSVQTRD